MTEKGYISLKFFASNVAYTVGGKQSSLKKYSKKFFQKLKEKNIYLDCFLGDGIMLMESLGKAINFEQIENLPASNSAINIFIVGEIMYIMIFKDIPFGIKIQSQELANTMHFLFDNVNIRS